MAYTYVWLEKGRPLYVGKGSGSRAGQHLIDKPWAVGKNLECLVFDCGAEAELAESFLFHLLRPFTLENKVVPSGFSPWRSEALPMEVMSAARAVMERVGTPPTMTQAVRFAELLEEARAAVPDFEPYQNLYDYLVVEGSKDQGRARMIAWTWLAMYGGDFESTTAAAKEYLYD